MFFPLYFLLWWSHPISPCIRWSWHIYPSVLLLIHSPVEKGWRKLPCLLFFTSFNVFSINLVVLVSTWNHPFVFVSSHFELFIHEKILMVPLSQCIWNSSISHHLYHEFSGEATNRLSLNKCEGLLLLPEISLICQKITKDYTINPHWGWIILAFQARESATLEWDGWVYLKV